MLVVSHFEACLALNFLSALLPKLTEESWHVTVCWNDFMLLNQVELFKHPHLLLLQVRNSIFKLPGGRLRPGESGKWMFNILVDLKGLLLEVYWVYCCCDLIDIDGLKRKLSRKLYVSEDGNESDWEVQTLSYSSSVLLNFSLQGVNYYLSLMFRWENVLECGGDLILKPCYIRPCHLLWKNQR